MKSNTPKIIVIVLAVIILVLLGIFFFVPSARTPTIQEEAPAPSPAAY